MKILTLEDAQACCNKLHVLGSESVVITSCELQDDPGHLYVIGSTRCPDHMRLLGEDSKEDSSAQQQQQQTGDQADAQPITPQQFYIKIPKLDAEYSGTGDITTALLLAHLYHIQPDADPTAEGLDCSDPDQPTTTLLTRAVELTIASVQGVIAETRAHQKHLVDCGDVDASKLNELRLVQSQRHFLHPKVVFRAVPLPAKEVSGKTEGQR